MKSEKLTLNNTELTLVFDKIDLPFQDKNLQLTKTLCYFNFKELNAFLIGELVRENDRVKLFDTEDEAKKFAIAYITEKYKTYL